ncbi:fructose 1,6-bisphosphatase [Candidatus Bathyarchaeota archaeon]|nr:fructose 1,6-bisphosphatase [Candidatus Bathyarchaeota archaeon]
MAEKIDWHKIFAKIKSKVQRQVRRVRTTPKPSHTGHILGAGGDVIEEADIIAENVIIDTLKDFFESFTLISEESGVKEYGKNPETCYVTVDPVDGSTNLSRGIPFYATSIAVSAKPTIDAVHSALVIDLHHATTYTAQRGRGAYRNGRKITPSSLFSLEEAVIGFDINTLKIRELTSKLLPILQRSKHVRHLGANALELCYVADGTTDAFIDIRGKLRTTDTAAAQLILREAGAQLTTPAGEPLKARLDPKEKVAFVASANRKLHNAILKAMLTQKQELL